MKLTRFSSAAIAVAAFLLSASSVSAAPPPPMQMPQVAPVQLYSWATTSWWPVQNAVAYNIYYRESGDTMYNYSVIRLPQTSTSYNVGYLKRGVSYAYRVGALNWQGAEFWWTPEMWMTNYQAQW